MSVLFKLAEAAEWLAWRLRSFADAHAEEHRNRCALTMDEKLAIMDLYMDGKPLCCREGVKNLRRVLGSSYWVEKINDDAYEMLGCSSGWKPGGHLFEDGKAKLWERILGEEGSP
jgi:hypothetical protein